MKTDGCVGMRGEVIEKLFATLHCLVGAFGLFACDCAEGHEDCQVDGAGIIQYAPDHALDFSSSESGGEVSGSIGLCASLPYCLGWGEKGQC